MKGLVISIIAFVIYVILTAVGAHIFKPKRHGRYFFPAIVILSPIYLILYAIVPKDCWFLPANWLCPYVWIDFLYGFVIFLLNVHSYIDYFFGFNGGFSTSVILNIFRAGATGLTSEQITARYIAKDGTDKILGWRLPALQDAGHLRIDPETDECYLTSKGRAIARVTYIIKRALNLGAGG